MIFLLWLILSTKPAPNTDYKYYNTLFFACALQNNCKQNDTSYIYIVDSLKEKYCLKDTSSQNSTLIYLTEKTWRNKKHKHLPLFSFRTLEIKDDKIFLCFGLENCYDDGLCFDFIKTNNQWEIKFVGQEGIEH